MSVPDLTRADAGAPANGFVAGTVPGPAPVGDVPGDPGLFGPGSVTWRVHADPLIGLAGIRALLLQALHPVALAGVMQNSGFREDPWGRLFRTAEFVGAITYGPTSEAQRVGARIRGLHRRVSGVEPVSGRRFRASDPDLLLWVHCCEVESFVTTAVRGGLRLTPVQLDDYYAEQVRSAALVGIPPEMVPADTRAMQRYFEEMRPELRVDRESRRVARFILAPPMPARIRLLTPARPAWFGLGTLAFGLLPRWARRMYRLPGLPTTDLSAAAAARALRLTLSALPPHLRDGPSLTAARERLGLGPGEF